MLDFDGTLVEIAPTPDAIVVPPDLPDLLGRLERQLGGALAVVSGRPIAEIDRHLAPARPIAFGLHGLERRIAPGGAVERPQPPPALLTLKADVERAGILGDGVFLEDKGLAFAIHYRQRPERETLVREAVLGRARGIAELSVICGKMVVEVKPSSASKGSAVMAISALPAFEGRMPVFVGDDTTDEDGFRAAEALGGVGIKVGEGETLASGRMPSVAAVHAWLRGIAA